MQQAGAKAQSPWTLEVSSLLAFSNNLTVKAYRSMKKRKNTTLLRNIAYFIMTAVFQGGFTLRFSQIKRKDKFHECYKQKNERMAQKNTSFNR